MQTPELKALKARFVGSLAARRRALDTALAQADLAGVAGGAHQIKGSGGNFGFPELTVCAGELERVARAGDAASAARSLAELGAMIDVICVNAELKLVKEKP